MALEFINQTSVSSGVVTQDVDNVFSSDYKIYFIQINGLYHNVDVSNGVEGIRFINSSGTVISSSDYAYCSFNMGSSGAFGNSNTNSQSYLWLGQFTDQQSDGSSNTSFYVFDPNPSTYTFVSGEGIGGNSSDTMVGERITGVLKSDTSIRGFQLYESNSARTFGGGEIFVYGLSE